MRPKVRLLIVVWGEAYIERFAALALPSLLARGNLPALAESADLQLVVLTSSSGTESFDRFPAFKAVRRICQAKFVAIDDLIAPGNYGVTLTLAFMRGIAEAGEAMTRTHFVFLNSDFILADGSLRNLLERILAGRSCIMAPSFRAIAEDVEPVLLKAVEAGGGRLAMPPREMVRLALDHLHPTIVAKTVNQGFCHSLHTNQLYWSVDRNTMLSRMFLIFMLCIRPERVVTSINSFCDYGFVPEMCPSGDIDVIADSDDAFILEAQGRLQEASHIRLGGSNQLEIGQDLAEWTTAEHRVMGTRDLVFHAEELPPSLDRFKAEADAYVRALLATLPRPKHHAFHHHWIGGFQAWNEQRAQAGKSTLPPEASRETSQGTSRIGFAVKLLNRVRRVLVSARPFVRIWHPDWVAYRAMEHALRGALEHVNGPVLLVRNAQTPVEAFIAASAAGIIQRSLEQAPSDTAKDRFAATICVLTAQALRAATPASLDSLVEQTMTGGEFLLVLHNMGVDEVRGDIVDDLIQLLAGLPVGRLECRSLSFQGGLVRQVALGWMTALQRTYMRYGLVALPLVAPAAVTILLFNVLNNLRRMGTMTSVPTHVSAMTLRFMKR